MIPLTAKLPIIGYLSRPRATGGDAGRGARPRGVLPRPSRLRPGSRAPAGQREPRWPRFAGDGGWKWKGLELGPEANRAADKGLADRQAAEGRDPRNYGEGGLTPAMRRIESELAHGTLAPDTEKFALKSPDRFKEKLAKMISLEPDIAQVTMSQRSTTKSLYLRIRGPVLLDRCSRRGKPTDRQRI